MAARFLLLVLQTALTSALQEWIEQPDYAEVNPGGAVTLVCRVTDKKGECRWERNSLPVGLHRGKYEWAGRQEAGDCSLSILDASSEYDSGDWVCQVTATSFTTRDTLISSPAKLVVRDPPKSVHLRVSKTAEAILGAISAPEGTQMLIDCVAKGGSPAPQLKWYLGDRQLADAHQSVNSAGQVSSTVSLGMLRAEHGRAVRCEAVHPALVTIVDVKSFLDIQYAPEVEITSSVPLRGLMEGASISLNCVVDANPAASILWYREGSGEVVSREGRWTVDRVEVGTAGRYSCQANNSLGTSQAKHVEVQVLFAPVIESVGPKPQVRQLYGTKLVLTCAARGNPHPKYTWVQYTQSGLEVRGEGRDLVLDRLVYEDEGKYECRALNSISGQVYETKSKPIEVDVYGSPKVAAKVSEVYVARGTTGQVVVEFCADPLPKQIWHIDSHPGQKILISEGTSHEGYTVLNATKAARPNCYLSTLEIQEVREAERSDYIVHFENEHGREIHTVKVQIGAFLGKETLIGGVIGGGMTVLVVLLLVVCWCTKCARNNKERKQDQESSGEVWSTDSVNSEISTATQQTNNSAATQATTASHNTSHSAISNHSVASNSTRHSILSLAAPHSITSARHSIASLRHGTASPLHGTASPLHGTASSLHSTASPRHGSVSPHGYFPDIIDNHCEKKNVSFTEENSVKTQMCVRGSRHASTTPVNYNDLCFPKTSNYGSMRKEGRCDFLTRSNIKRIDDIVRENELNRPSSYGGGSISGPTNFHANSEYQFS